jgi:mono/diheme cytochrome c family protein
MHLPERGTRFAVLVATGGVLVALNVLAARGTTRTVTTVTPAGERTSAVAGHVDGQVDGEMAAGDLSSRGAQLFLAKGCASCHVEFRVGPDLTDVRQRAGRSREGLDAEQYLRESIVAPNAYKAPGGNGGVSGAMPTLPVNDEELRALVAFLMTL